MEGIALPSSNESLRSTLTWRQELSPPAKQIGEGANKINYVPSNQVAWQVTFTNDGKYLAACYGGPEPCIRVWNYARGSGEWELVTVLSGIHERTVRSIAFAPIQNPIILASASFDGTLAIWEQEMNKKNNDDGMRQWSCAAQLECHDNEVKCVVWNATGSLLASCGRDKTVWIWECYLEGTVGSTGNGGDYECLAVLNGHSADVKCVLFAPSHGEWGDGDEILLSASYDDTIKCWAEDSGDWFCAATIGSVHTSTIWALTLAPSGTRLISGSADGSIAIYQAYSENEKKKILAAASEEEKRRLLNNSSGGNGLWKCVGLLPGAHHGYTVYSVSYASTKVGHCRLASGGADNCILICRERSTSTSNEPQYEVEVSVVTPTDVNCVCWHPLDGSILASAGDDGTVRIWNYHVS